jgi:hypothetical protein
MSLIRKLKNRSEIIRYSDVKKKKKEENNIEEIRKNNV